MASYTTKELRDIIVPIRSRIDDLLSRIMTQGLSHVPTDEIYGLFKCNTELNQFEIDMNVRDMIERSNNKKESK